MGHHAQVVIEGRPITQGASLSFHSEMGLHGGFVTQRAVMLS